jgi:hypothetical protein
MNSAADTSVDGQHDAEWPGTDERTHVIGRRSPTIELRFPHPNEAMAVRRLAELDSSPALTGQVVIALVNGDPVAGMSLRDQHVVANPFVPTREAVALLRLRAEHLSDAPPDRKLRRVLRRKPGVWLRHATRRTRKVGKAPTEAPFPASG